MATISYVVRRRVRNPALVTESYYNVTTNSPRVNGKLKLRTNSHSFVHQWETGYVNSSGKVPGLAANSPAGGYPTGPIPDLYNRAYASLISKVKHGSAELGVTLGSYAQTRSMIVQRVASASHAVEMMAKVFDRVSKKQRPKKDEPWASRVRRYKRLAKGAGSKNLEIQFGWTPFFQDIYSLCNSVCQFASLDDGYVTGRAKSQIRHMSVQPGDYYPKLNNFADGNVSCAVSAKVKVSNQNLWLLNRMGLINPLTVAWDLVPWSWVVNMVVNVNQVINSITDTVGLELTDVSVTRSYRLTGRIENIGRIALYTPPNPDAKFIGYEYGYVRQNFAAVYKQRESHAALPRPKLSLKVPNGNFFLAGIASSLLAQKVIKTR